MLEVAPRPLPIASTPPSPNRSNPFGNADAASPTAPIQGFWLPPHVEVRPRIIPLDPAWNDAIEARREQLLGNSGGMAPLASLPVPAATVAESSPIVDSGPLPPVAEVFGVNLGADAIGAESVPNPNSGLISALAFNASQAGLSGTTASSLFGGLVASGTTGATPATPVFGPQPVVSRLVAAGNAWTFRLEWPSDTAIAIPLPDVASMRIHDAFDDGDLSNSYEIHLDPGTRHLEIGLAPEDGSTTLPESMDLYDQTGRLYPADQAVQGSTLGPRAYIWNFASGGAMPTALYLKVSLPSSNGATPLGSNSGSSNGSPYVIRIVQSPSASASSETPTSGTGTDNGSSQTIYDYTVVRTPTLSSQPGGGSGSAPPTAITPSPTPSQADSPDSNSSSAGLVSIVLPIPSLSVAGSPSPTLVPVANGPLPTRSTAPLGGVLASGTDPVPPVDPHEAANGEVALEDPIPVVDDLAVAPPLIGVPQGAEGQAEAQVVAVRGPGGFPLLATALVAGMPLNRGLAHPGGLDGTTLADGGPDGAGLDAGSLAPSLGAEVQGRKSPRFSALSGMTWAVTFGVGLVLPDLVAAFQFKTYKRPRLRLAALRPRPRRPSSDA
ncbi:hypothetical protein [Singulisphaera sp. PoT]|uniref:hypothetical protein n=1 Tax=Singulisphaera sp. PoT TaxID=3411797 RepID=UPI003BF5ACEA